MIIRPTYNDYYLQSEGSISVLEHLEYIKDLSVTFDFKFELDYHINEKVNNSYCLIIYKLYIYIV